MRNTNFVFTPGKLTTILDAGAGSSGKGKIGSYICEHANNWQFACNTFAPQAGHWVKLDDGRTFFYQTFNSCAYISDRYEKIYLAPGATIELPAFWRELEENKIPRSKIGISPLTAILQDIDGGFERGQLDFDGNPLSKTHDGTMKTGTTAHGSGACRARRILRRKEAKYARDIPELREFICDVPGEIMARLDKGQAGLLEVAQGFQLSLLLPEMFPYTTSRNCTVMSGLDDLMMPVHYAGNVILNVRTFPIRINNNKYIATDGHHMTWAEVEEHRWKGIPFEIYKGNSGPGYDDQTELTWEGITKNAGSPTPIMEITSVTKLPRRVFSFSQKNLLQAIKYNKANGQVFTSLNFINYVDYEMTNNREKLTPKAEMWIASNIPAEANLAFVGTGARTNDTIDIKYRRI